ncbi:NUDIX hydrolase domain-like protein [Rhypophila decipiens]|uniref:NUDIX hydrolase domain-like protein n=1 Tax=Rhypophila decipiens TaxID=261697 RepID=A0AAN6Y393_9PEZI|nr:NUDIX hydrolase domain-like protein [Rhypophila decipiens]
MGTVAREDNSSPRQTAPTDAGLQDWLQGIDITMAFSPASGIVISCGTVTLDLVHGKVLLIWNNRFGIYQLPKGRKDIGETMLAAAVRETYEETGVRVKPFELMVATRATIPADELEEESRKKNPGVIEGQLSNEFIATCVYPDPQSETEALKIIFYFAATADSTGVPETETQEDWEKLRGEWVPISEVGKKLRFKAEESVVMKAVADAAKTGYTIGTTAEAADGDIKPGIDFQERQPIPSPA